MHEVTHFGAIVLLVSGAFAVAVFSNKLSEWSRVPTAAFFLLAAAVASDVWPALEDALSIQDVERIAVLALIVILFDGGMRVGWRRFRESAVPIVSLGLVGTFVTAGLMMLAAHYLLDFRWETAALLGAALAPTDPAVMFSVFGRKEVGGRTGTILEGESGANDPVGIALMLAAVSLAETDPTSVGAAIGEFVLQLGLGVVFGVAGGVRADARHPPRRPAEPGALPVADACLRRRDLRRRHRRPRVRLPRRLHRRDPDRRRRDAGEAADRALPYVAREPRGDRRLRCARAHRST